jgi:hypothetical protein
VRIGSISWRKQTPTHCCRAAPAHLLPALSHAAGTSNALRVPQQRRALGTVCGPTRAQHHTSTTLTSSPSRLQPAHSSTPSISPTNQPCYPSNTATTPRPTIHPQPRHPPCPTSAKPTTSPPPCTPHPHHPKYPQIAPPIHPFPTPFHNLPPTFYRRPNPSDPSSPPTRQASNLKPFGLVGLKTTSLPPSLSLSISLYRSPPLSLQDHLAALPAPPDPTPPPQVTVRTSRADVLPCISQ